MGFPSPFSDDPAPATLDRRGSASGARVVGLLFGTAATLVAAATGAFLAAGGDGRVLELFVLGAGLLLAYAAGRAFGAVVAVGLGATFLALEGHYGRLDGDHIGGVLVLTGVFAAAALASGHLRDRLETWNAEPARRRRRSRRRESEPPGEEPEPAVEVGSLDFAVHRALGSSNAISVLLVRPDGLPELAEREGQEATRAVLDRVSRILRRHLRSTDQLLRHSLFDFWVILPGSQVEAARTTAERVRLAIQEEDVDVDRATRIRATLSVGVAASPRDGEAARALMEAAQRALGAAVELGGNRTVLHSIPPGAPRGWGLDHDPASLDVEARA